MEIPRNFLSLLVRGDLDADENEYVEKVYGQLGWNEITKIVRKKKIIPFAARTFVECGLDEDRWSSITGKYRERNKNIVSFLDDAYHALHTAGVQKIFVSENFGALLSADADLSLFSSGDIDNFAPLTEREGIYFAMDSLGCVRKERFSKQSQIAAEFYPPEKYGLPQEFYFSVDFYPLARLKLPCFIDEKDFIDWAGLHPYKSTEIMLAPSDSLMYICLLHISLHSFSRAPDIRLYIDLLNMTKCDIDYGKIEEWCKRDRTCTRAATAAEISNRLMCTQIPDIITGLSSRKEKVMNMVYDAKKNDLIYEPHGLKVLKIETACDDKNTLHGIKEMVFPDSGWMERTYGGKGFLAHMKHIKNLF